MNVGSLLSFPKEGQKNLHDNVISESDRDCVLEIDQNASEVFIDRVSISLSIDRQMHALRRSFTRDRVVENFIQRGFPCNSLTDTPDFLSRRLSTALKRRARYPDWKRKGRDTHSPKASYWLFGKPGDSGGRGTRAVRKASVCPVIIFEGESLSRNEFPEDDSYAKYLSRNFLHTHAE